MKTPGSRAARALVLALVVALAGCDKWAVTVESRLDGGGRLARTTTIEFFGGDDEAKEDRIGPLFRIPEGAQMLEQTKKKVVFATSARNAREARPDFALKVDGAGTRPEPRNKVEWEKRDWIFFEQWVYREVYKDSVDESDRDEATGRIFSLCREIVRTAAAAEAGDRYDLARLHAWLDGPGRAAFFDVARIAVTEKDSKGVMTRIAARLGAEGMALPEEPSGKDIDAATLGFLRQKLPELLQPKPGQQPYDPEPLLRKPDSGDARIFTLVTDAAATIHGSAENAEKAFNGALKALMGDIGGHPIDFAVKVTLPGRLLRTNGYLDSEADARRDGTALFAFDTEAIARTGHVLEVESVVLKAEALAKLPTAKTDLSTRDVLRVIKALTPHDAAARQKLGAAFASLEGEKGPAPAAVRARLPEPLHGAFDEVLAAGSR